jgi:Asp-tRNA(Asn)/Glu-tRNA(Gln) amidotransferase A subunit family amidase
MTEFNTASLCILSRAFLTPVSGLYVGPPSESDKKKTAQVYSHSRSIGFGPEVKRRILLGTYALTAEYVPYFSSPLIAVNCHCII